MFRFVFFFTITILACTQYTLASNLHSSLHAPSTTSVISSGYGSGYGYQGHGLLSNAAINSGNHHGVPAHSTISSYSSTVVHPDSSVSHSNLGNSYSLGHYGDNHQQYISAPSSSLRYQTYSTPLVSGRVYGHSGLHDNSYAVQRSYTGPLAASGYSGYGLNSGLLGVGGYGAQLGQVHQTGYGLNSGLLGVGGYGAQLGQAYQSGISGHLSGW